MCKEMWVISVNKVVDAKRIRKKWMAEEEEERHKVSLTPKKNGPQNSLVHFVIVRETDFLP
jgi:hypothetical protein